MDFGLAGKTVLITGASGGLIENCVVSYNQGWVLLHLQPFMNSHYQFLISVELTAS